MSSVDSDLKVYQSFKKKYFTKIMNEILFKLTDRNYDGSYIALNKVYSYYVDEFFNFRYCKLVEYIKDKLDLDLMDELDSLGFSTKTLSISYYSYERVVYYNNSKFLNLLNYFLHSIFILVMFLGIVSMLIIIGGVFY